MLKKIDTNNNQDRRNNLYNQNIKLQDLRTIPLTEDIKTTPNTTSDSLFISNANANTATMGSSYYNTYSFARDFAICGGLRLAAPYVVPSLTAVGTGSLVGIAYGSYKAHQWDAEQTVKTLESTDKNHLQGLADVWGSDMFNDHMLMTKTALTKERINELTKKEDRITKQEESCPNNDYEDDTNYLLPTMHTEFPTSHEELLKSTTPIAHSTARQNNKPKIKQVTSSKEDIQNFQNNLSKHGITSDEDIMQMYYNVEFASDISNNPFVKNYKEANYSFPEMPDIPKLSDLFEHTSSSREEYFRRMDQYVDFIHKYAKSNMDKKFDAILKESKEFFPSYEKRDLRAIPRYLTTQHEERKIELNIKTDDEIRQSIKDMGRKMEEKNLKSIANLEIFLPKQDKPEFLKKMEEDEQKLLEECRRLDKQREKERQEEQRKPQNKPSFLKKLEEDKLKILEMRNKPKKQEEQNKIYLDSLEIKALEARCSQEHLNNLKNNVLNTQNENRCFSQLNYPIYQQERFISPQAMDWDQIDREIYYSRHEKKQITEQIKPYFIDIEGAAIHKFFLRKTEEDKIYEVYVKYKDLKGDDYAQLYCFLHYLTEHKTRINKNEIEIIKKYSADYIVKHLSLATKEGIEGSFLKGMQGFLKNYTYSVEPKIYPMPKKIEEGYKGFSRDNVEHLIKRGLSRKYHLLIINALASVEAAKIREAKEEENILEANADEKLVKAIDIIEERYSNNVASFQPDPDDDDEQKKIKQQKRAENLEKRKQEIRKTLKEHGFDIPEEVLDKILEAKEFEGYNVEAADKGVGIRIRTKSARYYIRISKGKPDSTTPSNKVDYVKITYEGKVIDKFGNKMSEHRLDKITNKMLKSSHHADSHIPMEQWIKWSKWFKP